MPCYLLTSALEFADNCFCSALSQKNAGHITAARSLLETSLTNYAFAERYIDALIASQLLMQITPDFITAAQERAFLQSKQAKTNVQLLLLHISLDSTFENLAYALTTLNQLHQTLLSIQPVQEATQLKQPQDKDLKDRLDETNQLINEVNQLIETFSSTAITRIKYKPIQESHLDEIESMMPLQVIFSMLQFNPQHCRQARHGIQVIAEKSSDFFLNTVIHESSDKIDRLSEDKKNKLIKYLSSSTMQLQLAIKTMIRLDPKERCQAQHVMQLYIYELQAKISGDASFLKNLIDYTKQHDLSPHYFSEKDDKFEYLCYLIEALFQLEGLTPPVIQYSTDLLVLSKSYQHYEPWQLDSIQRATEYIQQSHPESALPTAQQSRPHRQVTDMVLTKEAQESADSESLLACSQILEFIDQSSLKHEEKQQATDRCFTCGMDISLFGKADQNQKTFFETLVQEKIIEDPNKLIEVLTIYHDRLQMLLKYKDYKSCDCTLLLEERILHANNIHTLLSEGVDLGERFQLKPVVDFLIDERSLCNGQLQKKIQVIMGTRIERLSELISSGYEIKSYVNAAIHPPTTGSHDASHFRRKRTRSSKIEEEKGNQPERKAARQDGVPEHSTSAAKPA